MQKTGERVDEVDRAGNVVATHPVGYLKERMFLHKVSLIIPITGDNKILLAKRAKDKHPYPDTWCCAVGGKARTGESEEETAVREMKEEVGKVYPVSKVASFVYDENEFKAIFSVFTTKVPVYPEDLTLDPKEIQYAEGFSVDEVMHMISDNPEDFAPTFIPAIKEFAKHYQR